MFDYQIYVGFYLKMFCLNHLTLIFLVRKVKLKSMTGKEMRWEFEVGEDLQHRNIENEGMMENIQNVSLTFYVDVMLMQILLKSNSKIAC